MRRNLNESDEAYRARNREAQRRFRERNPGYWKEHMDAKYPGGAKEWKRQYNLQKTYGLSWEDFVLLLEKQGGKCGICREVPSIDRLDRAWQVDHCHVTGRVRGLLCRHCNLALGHFGDDVTRLQRAIEYLKE